MDTTKTPTMDDALITIKHYRCRSAAEAIPLAQADLTEGRRSIAEALAAGRIDDEYAQGALADEEARLATLTAFPDLVRDLLADYAHHCANCEGYGIPPLTFDKWVATNLRGA